MYRYDTHVHTMESSRCGKVTGADMARYYKEKGYAGIIVTDHFLNGSSRATDEMSWEEKVDVLMSGYESARAEGERIGLSVFFGFEFNFDMTEFLCYGLDREWLLAHKDCHLLDFREFSQLAHESGAFIVHAHPFRQRRYIKTIRLIPDCVDAVEVMNAAHPDLSRFDERAEWYADEFGLYKTGGSDNHVVNQKYLGGIETDTPISSILDYISTVKERSFKIFKFENPDFDGLASHGPVKI